jgi:hypothetical protein
MGGNTLKKNVRQAHGLPVFNVAARMKKTFPITQGASYAVKSVEIAVSTCLESEFIEIKITEHYQTACKETKSRSGSFLLPVTRAQKLHWLINGDYSGFATFDDDCELRVTRGKNVAFAWQYHGTGPQGASDQMAGAVSFKYCKTFLLRALKEAIRVMAEHESALGS